MITEHATESVKDTEEAAMARADATLSALLAQGFFRPVLEFMARVRNGSYLAGLRSVLSDEAQSQLAAPLAGLDACAAELTRFDDEQGRLLLECDYNRLFVGPARLLAPPYESYYRSEPDEQGRGSICGTPMLSVFYEYRDHGFDMPDEFVEFPDHMAVELEYLSLLAGAEAKAWEAGRKGEALQLQKAAAQFREDHLAAWTEEFAMLVAAGATTSFYPALAQLVVELEL